MTVEIVFKKEETREIQHPTLPITVVSLIPTAIQITEIQERMGKNIKRTVMDASGKPVFVNGQIKEVDDWKPAPIARSLEALSELIIDVKGDMRLTGEDGKPYEPTPLEWLNKFTMPQFDFRRMDPVKLEIEEGTSIFRDPDTHLEVPEDARRLWLDPIVGKRGMYLWDAEKNEPVRRENNHPFWQEISNQALYRRPVAEEAEKKDSPAPSIV